MASHAPTVLVVDDDSDVRDLAVEILADSGYRVLAAGNGSDALRVLAGEPAIDLLFTDIVMPGLDGIALARQAVALRPELKVIYASGYAACGLLDAAEPLLAKPYRPAQLAAEIGRALAA
jgi:CheY-like chemotaxis protein